MKDINNLVKKLTSEVQQRCSERIKLAAKSEKDVHKPYDAIDKCGISSIMKRKHGL